MSLKILFVMRTAAHFSYHETTVTHLVERGHDVHLHLDPLWNHQGPIDDRAFRAWQAEGHELSEGASTQRRAGFWRTVLFATREIRSFGSYCTRPSEFKFYQNRWNNYLPAWCRRLTRWGVRGRSVGNWFFGRGVVRRAMTLVEQAAPADPDVVAALRALGPDCVVASPTNMRFSEEVEYIKAARALGIPSAIPVLSWDNLTTKGLLHARPDLLLAWHEGHAKDARDYHGIAEVNVVVAGSPFFDKWFDATPIRARSATCARMGLDPHRPYVLYLGSSTNIARDESAVVLEALTALQASPDRDTRATQLVFRPHPANLNAVPRLVRAGVAVWPREKGLPDTVERLHDFRDALHHAVAAVGINTTGMVDALVFDVPCIALLSKKYRQTQEDATHFQRMVGSKGIQIAASASRFAITIGKLLRGDDRRCDARAACRGLFARPRGLGAQAGEAMAVAIEGAAARKTAAQITATLDEAFGALPPPVRPAVDREPPISPVEVPSEPLGTAIRSSTRRAGDAPIYAYYKRARDLVLQMLDDGSKYGYSDYWREEIAGFDYLFDASPLVVAKLREHTYHITGLKSYEYRSHHAAKAPPFAHKLQRLRDIDPDGLFVPEAPGLGGFGHRIDGDLVNLDTLKFYECLIGLSRCEVLTELREKKRRLTVIEIGAGWGGLAYQFKTLCPNTTYVIVDLPPTLLFSMVYLKAMFPDSTARICGETPTEELFNGPDAPDFVFVPAFAAPDTRFPTPDLAINVASFQEMTSEQVTGYVNILADAGCERIYSLNRDRSPYNVELSSVTELLATRYRVERVTVLPEPYVVLAAKPGKDREPVVTDYRHTLARLR
jgi:putative sugar O-methyltransferase